jgi:hypothetical protein
MPTIRRPRLLKAGVLRDMKPATLSALLSPYAGYFRTREVSIEQVSEPDFDFAALAAVLALSTEQTPPELVEHLDLLDLISDSRSSLNFETEYHQIVQGLREPDDGPADVAVKILLHAPEVALREFNRQSLNTDRSLVSLRLKPGMPVLPFTPGSIERLKSILVPWFKDNARSPACIIHHLGESSGEAFVIRHGDTLKRVGVVDEEGKSDSHIFRPEQLDVANFNRMTGEWLVSGRGAKLQGLYRDALGAVFHGSPNALAHSKRYSLEPLRDGPSSLKCDIHSAVQFAELKSLKLEIPGGQQITISRSPVFEALDYTNPHLLATAVLLEATIGFKLANRAARVLVRICPERDTIHGNASDPAIDAWLIEHQFANDDVQLVASA